jgi:hypothetical protein
MTEPQPSQLISQPVFFPGPMHEWQPLFRVGDPGTVAPASAGMFIPGRTCEISNGAPLCGARPRTALLPSTSDGSNDMTM